MFNHHLWGNLEDSHVNGLLLLTNNLHLQLVFLSACYVHVLLEQALGWV